MADVGEKGGTGAHTGEMAAFAFDTQVLLDATLLSDQAHQRFGLMGVELISDKDPGGLGIGVDGLSAVSGKVRFSARGSNAGCDDLSAGHVQIGDQTQSAMAAICKFLSLDVTRLYGQRGVKPLKCLDAGHLIGTCHMRPHSGECRSRLIHLTRRADLLSQFGGVVWGWGEPVPLPMRL